MTKPSTDEGKQAPNRKRGRKVKKVLIYPRFQLSLVALMAAVNLMTFGLIAAQSMKLIMYLRQLGEDVGLAPQHNYFKFVEMQSELMWKNLIFAVLLSFVLGSLYSLFLSHRLAGPIIRLKSYFADITKNRQVTQKLEFRKGDFFSELPESINNALDCLKK